MNRTFAAALGAAMLLVLTTLARAESPKAAPEPTNPPGPEITVATLEAALPGASAADRPGLLEKLRNAYEAELKRAEAENRTRDAESYRENLAILNRRPARSPDRETVPSLAEEATTPPTPPNALGTRPAPAGDEKPEIDAPPSKPKAVAGADTAASDLTAGDEAFRAKRYEEAGRHYARLAQAGQLPDVRRKPWAYCRMAGVVARINAAPTSADDWRAIQAEIEEIRRLSPKNWYAEYLRNLALERSPKTARRDILRGAAPDEPAPAPAQRTIRRTAAPKAVSAEGSKPPVVAELSGAAPSKVGHAGTPIGSWKVWETPNFRILHADQALAEQVAAVAEAAREEHMRRWSGSTPAGPWAPRCDLYLYPTAAIFQQMTGQPATSPGFSTMGLDAGRVVARRVNLRADHPNLIRAILPHEITHVVLADLFPTQQIPRWADEGMAVLSEPPSEQDLRAADLAKPLATGELFKLSDLMVMDYPEGRHWSLYYAQSVSLTRFLVEQGTPPQFIEFVRNSQRTGIDAELKRIYKIDGIADLQNRWLSQVRAKPSTLAASDTEKPGADRTARGQ